MLEVTLTQASLLKKVIESMKDMVNEANFDCSSTGITLQAFDPTHVAMVTLLLRSDGFRHYRCDRNLTMGLNLHTLAEMLTCADNHDTVTIKADDGSDCVTFKFDSIDTDFDMKLMNIDDSDHFEIPELEYNAIVQMPSSEFARICKDLSTIADYYVVVSVTKEEMKFSTKGHIGTTSIVCIQKTSVDKQEEGTIIEMYSPVSLTLSLKLLSLFTKATPLASQVTMSLCTDGIFMIEYKIEEMGNMRFYLAPKTEEVKWMNDYNNEPKSNRNAKRRKRNKVDLSYFNKEDMEDRKRHRAKIVTFPNFPKHMMENIK